MLSQTAVQHVPVTSDLLLCIRCVVLHVNEPTWQCSLVWSSKQFWLKYRWSEQLLIFILPGMPLNILLIPYLDESCMQS